MQLSLASVLRAPVSGNQCRSQRSSSAFQTTGIHLSRAHRPQLQAARAAGPRRQVVAYAAAEATAADSPEVLELKMALLDSFWGTERGLTASSDSRAEINELITQLEARNPTPEPNEARQQLGGTWRLAYTSNSELIALLALARLPLVSVGEIVQMVDPEAMTVENRVELSAPLSKTSLSATASFEVRSPKLLQVSFEEGRVATPQLLADLDLPASVEVMGQQLDLAPLQAVLQPVEGPLRSALSTLGGLLSGAPDLRIPIRQLNAQASTWLLNTYLDDTLRITRGDGGSVFVLVRDSSQYGSDDSQYNAANMMQSSDWERIEEQDPPASSPAADDASSAAAEATVAAAAAAAVAASSETVVVVEPSAVIEEGGMDGPGSNGTL